jgi:hypothetical protein
MHRRLLAQLAVGLFLLDLVASQSVSPCVPGTDHPNEDLPGMPIRPAGGFATPDLCGLLCLANPLCTMCV